MFDWIKKLFCQHKWSGFVWTGRRRWVMNEAVNRYLKCGKKKYDWR